MEKREQMNIGLGTAVIFIIITNIVSLVNGFILNSITNDGFKKGISAFFSINVYRVIVIAVIITLILLYMKRINQRLNQDLILNKNTCLFAGILLILQGIIDLSCTVPIYIEAIINLSELPQSTEINISLISRRVIIVDIISVVLILCQISAGIYLAKFYRRNKS